MWDGVLPLDHSWQTLQTFAAVTCPLCLTHTTLLICAQLAKKGEKLVKPDYERCIAISTQASLREMIAPGCLVIVTPVLAGALFGVESVSGLLTGAIVSSVQLAISMSNTGGAWDNSKKYTEKGELNGYFPFRDGSPEFNEEQFRKVRVVCCCVCT